MVFKYKKKKNSNAIHFLNYLWNQSVPNATENKTSIFNSKTINLIELNDIDWKYSITTDNRWIIDENEWNKSALTVSSCRMPAPTTATTCCYQHQQQWPPEYEQGRIASQRKKSGPNIQRIGWPPPETRMAQQQPENANIDTTIR